MALVLTRALNVARRYPYLLVCAIIWSYFKNLALRQAGNSVFFHFRFQEGLLPAPRLIGEIDLVALLLGVLFSAGYLYLWREALEGRARPNLQLFRVGLSHFWGRLVGWGIVVHCFALLAGFFAMSLFGGGTGGFMAAFALIGLTVAFVSYSLVEPVIVARDRSLWDAVSDSPYIVGRHLLTLLGLWLIGIVLSAVLLLATNPLGIIGLLVAPLVGGLLEALGAGAIMALVVADDR